MQRHAVLIGVNAYQGGIPALRTPVLDARELGHLLEQKHGYNVRCLVDGDATKEGILAELAALKARCQKSDRVLFYFAGHGFADNGTGGPTGYFVPSGAGRDPASFLPMRDVHKALEDLDCLHLFAILDCCFAGSFEWAEAVRELTAQRSLTQESYAHYQQTPAWQVLTSTAYNQEALDVVAGKALGMRREAAEEDHSPFAAALLSGLDGEADLRSGDSPGDGVILASELHVYLETKLRDINQVPRLFPLKQHQQGEYLFNLKPGDPSLPAGPKPSPENNPYRGLQPYERQHADLFFGRRQLSEELQQRVLDRPLVVVTGPSGSGKSSLVKAGLVPGLLQQTGARRWSAVEPLRPDGHPLRALGRALLPLADKQAELRGSLSGDPRSLSRIAGQFFRSHPGEGLVLVVDQMEQLISQCRDHDERRMFMQQLWAALDDFPDRLRIIATLRSDYEGHFHDSDLGGARFLDSRFPIRPMTAAELRQVIQRPAKERDLYFEDDQLVDQLVAEVISTPDALPLLSFTLSEMYLRYIERAPDNRVLAWQDYHAIGGVTGALTHRATQLYTLMKQRHPAYDDTVRRVMLRMVAIEGGEIAGRRVPLSELEYRSAEENERVAEVIRVFSEARLVVTGGERALPGLPGGKVLTKEPEDLREEAYVEPAHAILVLGWDQFRKWRDDEEEQETLALQRLLTPVARDWDQNHRPSGVLWDDNPRLELLKQVLVEKDGWLNRVESEFVEHSIEKRKRARRRRLLAVAAVILVLAVMSGWSMRNAYRAARQARLSLARQLASQATSQLDDQLDLALLLAAQARHLSSAPQVVSSLHDALQYSPYVRAFLRRPEGEGSVQAVAISPAADARLLASGYSDGTIVLWSTRTHQPLHTLNRHRGRVSSLEFSPDGKTLASGSLDGTVLLWDMSASPPRARPLTGASLTPVECLSFSPDMHLLAAGRDDATVLLWDLSSGQPAGPPLTGHTGPVLSLGFSPDGKLLASGSTDQTVRLWDLAQRTAAGPPLRHEARVTSVKFSREGHLLAAGAWDHTVSLWDVTDVSNSTRLGDPLRAHQGPVWSIAFSPDGRLLASGSTDETVLLWSTEQLADPGSLSDPDRRRPIGLPLPAHGGPIRGISFSPDGRVLATAGDAVILWDLLASRPLGQSLPVRTADIYGVTFSPDSKLMATSDVDNHVQLWDVATRQPVGGPLPGAPEKGTGNRVFSLSFSPDGSLLAAASWDGAVRLWDVAARRPLGPPLRGHTDRVYGVSFSPDGKLLASSSRDRSIILWNVQAREAVSRLVGHDGGVYGSSFSPDGKILASGGDDRTIRLWDVLNGTQMARLEGHQDRVYSVRFSPDGRRLASAGYDNTVRLWDLSTPEHRPLSIERRQHVIYVGFSHDGKILVSGDEGNRVVLWDAKTLQRLGAPLEGQQAIFSGDGKMLAVADGTLVSLRDPSLKDPLTRACERANRNLSLKEWNLYVGTDRAYCRTCPGLEPGTGAPKSRPCEDRWGIWTKMKALLLGQE